MKVDIDTLESMGAWEIVDGYDSMNLIDSTRAFKLKCYPSGLIKNSKNRFCARGDQNLEGIDFFETYTPVVQWKTVQLMSIIQVLPGLKSNQGDVIAAFLHSYIPDNEKVYVEIPTGFEQFSNNGRKKCLKLKKTLAIIDKEVESKWSNAIKL